MKIFYKALFLCVLCLAFASCAQDETTEVVASEGSVRLAFRVVDGVQTRATELGWDGEWNENKIDRLDLFLFSGDNLYKHIEKTGLGVDASSYQELESELTYTEVANGNYTYYMVANCKSLAGFDGTLTELKEKVTPDLVCNQKQSSFVMDGIGILSLNNDATGKTATLTFDLSRAAAKIRVSVLNADETQSIIGNCSFRLCNYVESGTSVLAEAETYGAGADKRKSMDNDMPIGKVPVYVDEKDNNKNKVVFYSYPNDWFDEDKLSGKTDEWTITDFVKEDPIVPDRQTYILLLAPYNGTDYYYKVPVNFSTYTNNDKVSFTDGELEEIRSLFRIDRNSIYDITVTIDREGGPISSPVTPTFYVRINDWNPGGDYNIGAGEFE